LIVKSFALVRLGCAILAVITRLSRHIGRQFAKTVAALLVLTTPALALGKTLKTA